MSFFHTPKQEPSVISTFREKGIKGIQQRLFTRQVTLRFKGKSYGPCRIKDLSLSGMYVCGEFNKSKGQTCQIVFRQTGLSSKLTINVSATVVRADKEGLTIEFTSMALDSYILLQILLVYEPDEPFPFSQKKLDDPPFEIKEIAPENSKKKKIIQLYSCNV